MVGQVRDAGHRAEHFGDELRGELPELPDEKREALRPVARDLGLSGLSTVVVNGQRDAPPFAYSNGDVVPSQTLRVSGGWPAELAD